MLWRLQALRAFRRSPPARFLTQEVGALALEAARPTPSKVAILVVGGGLVAATLGSADTSDCEKQTTNYFSSGGSSSSGALQLSQTGEHLHFSFLTDHQVEQMMTLINAILDLESFTDAE